MYGLGLSLVGLIRGSYWDVSRDLINPGWVTRARLRGMMLHRPETPMSLGYITDDTSQFASMRCIFIMFCLFKWITCFKLHDDREKPTDL